MAIIVLILTIDIAHIAHYTLHITHYTLHITYYTLYTLHHLSAASYCRPVLIVQNIVLMFNFLMLSIAIIHHGDTALVVLVLSGEWSQ